jgi:alkanesulfonate monooxygenase SsuD/methylene tetrahydromethanopterin reductase-like flavin-dependent oxidoreductase (luciferase family)
MGGLQEDIVRHYEDHLQRHGYRRSPDHVIVTADAHVASSTEEAVKELAPYRLYFSRTLFSHGNITEANLQQQAGYLSSTAFDYVRPENMPLVARAREDYRDLTLADIERQAERAPWGTPAVVAQRIIAAADRVGANTVLVSLNRGGTPKEMFLEQIRRFGREVLPALHAHQPQLSSSPA